MAEYIVATDDHEGHWYTGEEIVRCKDCRYFIETTCECRQFAHEETSPMTGEPYECCETVDPDGYCAWGEPREP